MRVILKDFLTPRKRKREGFLDTTVIESANLNARYNEFVKEIEKVGVAYYSSPRDDSFIARVNIPSRVNDEKDRKEKVFYSVVVEFYNEDESRTRESNVRNYNIRIFSNAPSFAFKYAYVYYHNDLLIPELTSKFDGQMLSDPPTKLNPKQDVGMDYTIYFALRYLSSRYKHINKINMKYYSGTLDDLVNKVPDCYEIIRRHRQESKYSLKHVKNKLSLKMSQMKQVVLGKPKKKPAVVASKTVQSKRTKTTKVVKKTKVIAKKR